MPKVHTGPAGPGEAIPSEESEPLELWYLKLAYDGTDFAGWQKQSEAIAIEVIGCVNMSKSNCMLSSAALKDVRTIQTEVDKALSLVFRRAIRTVGASRTDSGVHAQGWPTAW